MVSMKSWSRYSIPRSAHIGQWGWRVSDACRSSSVINILDVMARSPNQTSAWDIYLIREKAKYLGKVEAANAEEAIAIAQRTFEGLSDAQKKRLSAQPAR
jgi:hypothetical protein